MDATKLESWLPVLTHPEHGAAICEAAGCVVGTDLCSDVVRFKCADGARLTALFMRPETLTYWAIAALAFGTLAVMADNCEVGGECLMRSSYGGKKGWIVTDLRATVRSATAPAAVLAAAYRWLGIRGGA